MKCHLSTVLTVAGEIMIAIIIETYQLSAVTVRYIYWSVFCVVSEYETQCDEESQDAGSVTCEDLFVTKQ